MQTIEKRNDIDMLKKVVEKYFKVYDIRWDEEVAAFYTQIYNIETVGDSFKELRTELKNSGYTPILRYEKGEHTILVMKKPKMNYKSVKVNIIMLILTLFSTIWTGSIYWAGRGDWNGDKTIDFFTVLLEPEYVLFGALSFALPLMTILGAHELAHYFAAKRHNVDASLPFFLPVPPVIGVFGTFGAFISMREPIPNKKALVDIGAAGPIAGFIVAIPVTILGLILSDLYPVASPPGGENVVYIGVPLIFSGLETIFPIPSGMLMHPTLFAGWVGLFVTGLNLLPCGQLDGGHIARALAGDKSKYLSYLTIASMIGVGFIFQGWFVLAILIIFLGLKHPPPLDDISKLDSKRKFIGIFAILMLVLCFHPAPLVPADFHYDVELISENIEKNITSDEMGIFTIMVENPKDLDTKNIYANINLSKTTASYEYWDIVLIYNGSINEKKVNFNREIYGDNYTENISIELDEDEYQNLTLYVKPPKNATHSENLSIEIHAVSENKTSKNDIITLLTTIQMDYGLNIQSKEYEKIISSNETTNFNLIVKNTGKNDEQIKISMDISESYVEDWNISLSYDGIKMSYENTSVSTTFDLSSGSTKTVLLTVEGGEETSIGDVINIEILGEIIGVSNKIGMNELNFKVEIS